MKPDLLVISSERPSLCLGNEDPRLWPNTHTAEVIGADVVLASNVDGLRLEPSTTLGDRYRA